MPNLPAVIITLLLPFEHLFDPRTWRKAQLLAMGAILSPGKRTVSSHEQKSQLEPQANRLWAHAGQNGIKLDQVVSEVASGLNDRRPELRRLLADPKVGTILAEHRDRLARFGVSMVDAMLQARGGGLLVPFPLEDALYRISVHLLIIPTQSGIQS